jgi:hypothetical protein
MKKLHLSSAPVFLRTGNQSMLSYTKEKDDTGSN